MHPGRPAVPGTPVPPPGCDNGPVPRAAVILTIAALVWTAVVLWSLNAVISKIILDSAGLSSMRLAQVRAHLEKAGTTGQAVNFFVLRDGEQKSVEELLPNVRVRFSIHCTAPSPYQ